MRTSSCCRVNTYNQFDTGVPFGGYKTSGIGREHGEEVLSHYTQVSSNAYTLNTMYKLFCMAHYITQGA